MKRVSLLLIASLLSPCLAQNPSRFEKEVLVAGCSDPLQLESQRMDESSLSSAKAR
jgi:hypothetical protein